MALLKFLKGDYAKLNTAAISEGQVFICEDTCEMFVDIADNNRIKIGDFITVANIEALGQFDVTAVPTSRLYYVEDGNILARSNGTTWVQVNKQKTADELKVLLGLDEYATIEFVNSKHPYEILDNGNVVFASDIIANKNISLQKTSTGLNSLRATVGNLEQDIENTINTRVKLFHATLDPVTTQYIKDSGDFTYADVVATENCKIEATFGNIKIIFNKEIIRNIVPDPVTGRYVEFSALLRNGLSTVKVFLFVYDSEHLPTDAVNVAALENWGDSQYCGISVQHVVIGDFLDNDVIAGRNNTINAPSTKAVGDYTDSQCGAVLDYMNTTFANNIMALVRQEFGPHIIYDDPTGFEASNDQAGDTWHLTGLDLKPYKRLKFYVRSGGDGDSNYSPSHIVEMHLDDRAKGSFGYFSADHAGHCPNNRNRHHIVTFTVNAEKTAIQFQHSISMYGTSASDSVGGRRCYLIEGYLL